MEANNTSTTKDIRILDIIGKTICEYDTWYGYNEIKNIEQVLIDGNSVRIGTKEWRNTIYIDVDCFNELVSKGHATKEKELDGCAIHKSWDLI